MRRNNSNSVGTKWKVYPILTAVTLVVIAGFLIVSNWRMLGKVIDSVKYRKAAEANLKNLSDREINLTNNLKELGTDTGLDKEIRERFPVAKPGEEVIMIVPGSDDAGTDNNTSSVGGWWNKFLDFFRK